MHRVLVVLAAGFALMASACGGSASGGSITIVPGDSSPTIPPGTPTNTLVPGETAAPTSTADSAGTPAPTATERVEPLPCGDILVPVGKQLALPSDCAPSTTMVVPGEYSWQPGQELIPEALDALISLLEAARTDGYEMFVESAYRSYSTQVGTFNYWVSYYGSEAEAARISARPGHSEHQLGTTLDLTVARNGTNLDAFVGTPEAAWVRDNAWRFGYVVSYPEGMEAVTGYVWEPWHIRYVGEDVAREIRESGLTPGEFLARR
ncbi:MAG: D-alanyl-D-alanine carboxypeptidase family protein [Dehalococcoidia bacterium]|nr:D-alanyl-D-alanine carboxypeptidase family protein [Dehalococcoidia bacterium]